MNTEVDINDEGPRDFARFLALLADGEAHRECSVELHELGKVMQHIAQDEHREVKGKLTLEIGLKTDALSVVSATYTIKVAKPSPSRPKTVLWMTDGANFTPENPRQQKLPLRAVEDERRVKEV